MTFDRDNIIYPDIKLPSAVEILDIKGSCCMHSCALRMDIDWGVGAG